jgi:uncharacterized membrane protein YhaH (DUF805 family)
VTNSHEKAGPNPVQPAGVDAFTWLFFRFDGRISRQVYWLSIFFLWSVLFVIVGAMVAAMGEEKASEFALILGLASLWLEMAVLVKRQRDRGLPWYWCLLAFVPIAGLVWMIAMGVVPGDPGPNAFGDRPDTPPA